MRTSSGKFYRILIAAILLCVSFEAAAHDMDLALGRLAYPCRGPTRSDKTCQQGFHNLMRDYSYALAPKLLAPAETLGYSGFYIGLEGSLTPLDNSAGYLKEGTVVQGSSDAVLFVPALHIRKGLPWSFEIGGSINYMANTELVGIGGDLKWSLFEGFREGVFGGLPDVAVRTSVVRLLGSPDVDVTVIGLDGSISWAVALGGMVVLTPYAGYQHLWSLVFAESVIVGQSQQKLPAANTPQDEASYQFDKETLTRHRPFVGLRFLWEHLTLTPEFSMGVGDGAVATQISLGVGTDF